MTLRERLAATCLFRETGRTLSHEAPAAAEHLVGVAARTVFVFDSFGDLIDVQSYVVDLGMRAIVAALGLPPQENP